MDIGYISFKIPKNRKWTQEIEVREETVDGALVDLTNITVQAQIRRTADLNSELIGTVTVTHNDAGGTLTLVMDNSSNAIVRDTGWIDLVFITAGVPETWASGPVKFVDLPTVVV